MRALLLAFVAAALLLALPPASASVPPPCTVGEEDGDLCVRAGGYASGTPGPCPGGTVYGYHGVGAEYHEDNGRSWYVFGGNACQAWTHPGGVRELGVSLYSSEPNERGSYTHRFSGAGYYCEGSAPLAHCGVIVGWGGHAGVGPSLGTRVPLPLGPQTPWVFDPLA